MESQPLQLQSQKSEQQRLDQSQQMGTGVKVSYIVSASKMNPDKNIRITELIANKNRTDQSPFFQLALEGMPSGSAIKPPRINSYERDDGILSDDPVSTRHIHHMQQMESAKKAQVNKSLNNPYRHRGDALHVDEHTAHLYQTQDD